MADSDNQIDYDYTEMNMCFNEKHSTPFASDKNMDQMQEMVRHSNPKAVTDVAVGWDGLSKALISIQRDFDKEVARIQEHWKGTAADRFAEKAKRVSKSLGDCAKYASHTSTAMQNAGSVLSRIKDEVLAMEKPSALSSALNSLGDGFTRSDEGMKRDLASGKGAQATLDANHDDLSAGREAQLAMAAKMETLGAAYNSQAKAMGSWNRKPQVREDEDYPGDPGGYPPTPVAMPTSRTPQSPRSVSPGTARPAQTGTISPSKPVAPPSGVTGGAHKPPVPTHNVGTAIDGISGGRPGTPPTGGGGPVSTGSAGPGGAVASPGLVAGAPGGVPGTARGGSAGRVGGGMASGARAGGTAGGAAGTARGGVVGRPGAGGVGGAAGAGAGGKGGAARAGGMARQSGGVVGGTPRAGAGAGRGTAGGAGLHSSRGAAGRGASAVHRGGIAGAPGARTGRPKDQEQREGERPDYLVEDEETWTPQRNVAPRVIEE
ncbi:PPE domain-containing protein [Streptomyces leeuwenhoekii]|uniref:PPE domain-containing protein n=1 Tax=Streptomyces leeuwenhoekii TaxID=1437453 RepID=UPI00099DA961|nr:PPE domain-containing protein [Streptomyces leeuwenhoekii]